MREMPRGRGVGSLLGGVALLRCCREGLLGGRRHGFTRVSRAINGTVRVAYDWIKDGSTGVAAN